MKNNMKDKIVPVVIVALMLVVAFLIGAKKPAHVVTVDRNVGSVEVSSEYSRLNIANSAVYGATTTPRRTSTAGTIKTGSGALGSIVITGAAAGLMNFYDATTSDVTKRTDNVATSSILLASIPASLVAGTYTFDIEFKTGLFVDINGTYPTTTVTYRQN